MLKKYLLAALIPFVTFGVPMDANDLTLYYKPTCPFCQKVIYYMDKHNIVVPMEDTTDPEQQSTLISIGGKKQVPCLVIGGEALYESDAIVAWLGEHMRGD